MRALGQKIFSRESFGWYMGVRWLCVMSSSSCIKRERFVHAKEDPKKDPDRKKTIILCRNLLQRG